MTKFRRIYSNQTILSEIKSFGVNKYNNKNLKILEKYAFNNKLSRVRNLILEMTSDAEDQEKLVKYANFVKNTGINYRQF